MWEQSRGRFLSKWARQETTGVLGDCCHSHMDGMEARETESKDAILRCLFSHWGIRDER